MTERWRSGSWLVTTDDDGWYDLWYESAEHGRESTGLAPEWLDHFATIDEAKSMAIEIDSKATPIGPLDDANTVAIDTQ